MMQSIAAFTWNLIDSMQRDAVHHIIKIKTILICNVFRRNGIHSHMSQTLNAGPFRRRGPNNVAHKHAYKADLRRKPQESAGNCRGVRPLGFTPLSAPLQHSVPSLESPPPKRSLSFQPGALTLVPSKLAKFWLREPLVYVNFCRSRGGANLGLFVPVPGWHYPGVRLQIWVCLICVISTCSNRAVETRLWVWSSQEHPCIFVVFLALLRGRGTGIGLCHLFLARLCPLAGDDCRLTYSNGAVQIRLWVWNLLILSDQNKAALAWECSPPLRKTRPSGW